VATLAVNTLSAGSHSLTAAYAGDGTFAGSTSAPVTTVVAARDFSLDANPPSATVMAGQSTAFTLTVTPAGGFTDRVTFSCPAITGITCTFNPPAATPNASAATTMLTVTTSAGVSRYGQIAPGIGGWGTLLASFGLIGALALFEKKTRPARAPILRAIAGAMAVLAMAFTLVSCGGYTTSGAANRGTASIVVTAQAGALTHTATVRVTVQ